MNPMPMSFGRAGTRTRAGARGLLELLVGVALLASMPGIALAAPAFTATVSVSPLIQYLNDTTGTTFTLTVDNTGDVAIGAVEITRPTTLWTVTACPAAPSGWSTQRADTKCRYRSADTAADDIAGGTMSSAFQFRATTGPGTQNVTGTWTVVVSRTNGFDDKSKLKTAAPEAPGLAITAYTFQILDAVVVASVLTPGSACPAPTGANHSAGSGATRTIAICGRNRASIALTPVAGQSSLAGTFATGGTFTSSSISANSASSVVLGNWSNATVNSPSGTGKSIVARIGSASNRTSPLTTLDDTCPSTATVGATCIANGGYEAIDDAPFVTSTLPANAASTVPTNTNIVVNFSESVTAGLSSFTLECPTGITKSFTISGSPGSSITLDPTADLPQGTVCTVTAIASQISDTDSLDPPDHPTANHAFSFTTDSAPAVTSTSPLDGATGVSPGANLTVTFSEPVNATTASFSLECPGGVAQAFVASGTGTSTITLDPAADLPVTTTCTVTVLASGISDVDAGDPPDNLAANHVFSFTTQDAAPIVTSVSPADGADHVGTNSNIVVNFSESVSAGFGSFTLECPTGTPKSFTVSGSPGSSITLDPTADLPQGAICTVTVVASQISDVDAVDPPDQMAANYVSSFTTDNAPNVTTTTPIDGAANVDPSANITVNFTEAVDVSTSSFTISCDGNAQTFQVSGSGTSSIALDPDSDLPSTASCTVTAIAASISDVDGGDPPDSPAANYPFSFTTTDAAPSVTTTTPADGATGVLRGSNIVVNFSESVTAGLGSFTLECPTGITKSFTISGSPGSSITLDPTADLPQGTVCTVTAIASQISDVDAVDPPDQMAANYVSSFTVVTNQMPTDIALSNANVDENQPSATAVGTLSTTDPDAGDTFTYTFATGTGDTDNGSFQIVGDELQTTAVFDFETKSSYSIRVRSTDSGSLFFDKVFTVSINDVNEAPTDIALSNASIDENQPSNTTIGGLTATDPDSGQTHTFSLANTGCGGGPFNDNGSFSISGGDLKSGVSFNFEDKSSYTICVRTTDSGTPNLSFDKQFTISINDVNDAPVAGADSYSGAIGNTLAVLGTTASGPNVVLTGNVLTNNDSDEDLTFPHTLSAVPETVSSTGGGSATINLDGSFTFLPGVGDKNQNDTFTYHVSDGAASSAGTVTVGIANFLVWYVDNASVAATNDGRSSSPFLDLSSLNGAGGSGDSDGPDDYIFLYTGSGSYLGGIPLEATQKLFGAKHGLLVNGHQLVNAGAPAPVITNASGNGVGLANGVDVQGLDITGASGDGINGSAVTTATVGTTTAVNITDSGGDGVDLFGAATGDISVASPITGSAGHSVSVANRFGGTVSFSGSITDSGTGISLSTNTGATINFSGGVTASTGASSAFKASGGGTVTVTGSSNALATTTGTALQVSSTTIGSSGLNFRSISSNGAAIGIKLDTTGSSGSLVVAGNGGTCTNANTGGCSGGQIQNSSGADDSSATPAGTGIVLKDTKAPSLTRMWIHDNSNYAIRGTGVAGFTLANSVINGTNGTTGTDPFNDSSVRFDNLTGSASVADTAVSGGYEDNFSVSNTAGSLDRITFTNVNVGLNSTLGGNDGLGLQSSATAGALKATVTNSTFTGAAGDLINYIHNGTGAGDLVLTGNAFSNNHPAIATGGGGLTLVNDGTSGNTTMTVTNNTFRDAVGPGILVVKTTGASTQTGTYSNNTIGVSGVANTGSREGSALKLQTVGQGALNWTVTGNQVYGYNNFGIEVLAGGGATAQSGSVNMTITGNTIAEPGTTAGTITIPKNGIHLNIGTVPGDTYLACAVIGGAGALANLLSSAGADAVPPVGGGQDVRLRQRQSTTIRLPGYAGAATDTSAVQTFVAANNPSGPPSVIASVSSPPGGGFTGTGIACP